MKAHTRVISIPNIFCKLHHMGLTLAEDIFRISEEIPKANDGPGRRGLWGREAEICPLFLFCCFLICFKYFFCKQHRISSKNKGTKHKQWNLVKTWRQASLLGAQAASLMRKLTPGDHSDKPSPANPNFLFSQCLMPTMYTLYS